MLTIDEQPALFDAKGVFHMPPDDIIEQLDEGQRQRLHAVRDACMARDAAIEVCKEHEATIATLLEQQNAIKQYLVEHFPPPTFAELWRQSKRI